MAAPRAASGASSSASRGSFGSATIATHELLLSSLPVLSPGSCLGMQGGGRGGATLCRDSPVPVVQVFADSPDLLVDGGSMGDAAAFL